jgi:hypothetical protein
MSSLTPRVVIVTRLSEFDRLMTYHATRGQAEFYLAQRGQDFSQLERQHDQLQAAIADTKRAVQDDWSIAHILRDDLDRFLFSDRDIIVAIGQDGLVANVAKYLAGQPVIGVAASGDGSEGILTAMSPAILPKLLPRVAASDATIQQRTMVEATLDDGQTLLALNELFIGHRSHQSARYLVRFGGKEELQSSSGIIVSTGTGLTGWARSIMTSTHRDLSFEPEARRAAYFAREPWPSKQTGCKLVTGEINADVSLAIVSRMNDGGIIFADGIEHDFLRFDWGNGAKITLAARTLNLVRTA